MPEINIPLYSSIPPSSQKPTSVYPKNIINVLGGALESLAKESVNPINNEKPPPFIRTITPEEVATSVSVNQKSNNDKKKNRRLRFWIVLLIIIIAVVIILVIVIAVAVVLSKRETNSSTNLSSSASTRITTRTTTTTTTAYCVTPYVVSSSGSCVNILIDINNCGSLAYKCPSNYTSCSGGVCSTAPGVQLSNSQFIWTAAINGSMDDKVFNLTLPFNILMYNTSAQLIYVSTNGAVCLGTCSIAFANAVLPTTSFTGVTILPYWDDLYIFANTSQGIYYATQGNAPNRTFVIEFYTSHYNQSTQYYHFQVIFFEGVPGVVQYKYFDASDGGVTATVGVQASVSGPFIQYSSNLANSVRSNMSLIFNTNLGIYVNATF